MSLQAIIVDDEAPARDRVRDLLARETDVAIAAECANGREAVAAINSCRPDLLFLDIQMPQVNGSGGSSRAALASNSAGAAKRLGSNAA